MMRMDANGSEWKRHSNNLHTFSSESSGLFNNEIFFGAFWLCNENLIKAALSASWQREREREEEAGREANRQAWLPAKAVQTNTEMDTNTDTYTDTAGEPDRANTRTYVHKYADCSEFQLKFQLLKLHADFVPLTSHFLPLSLYSISMLVPPTTAIKILNRIH